MGRVHSDRVVTDEPRDGVKLIQTSVRGRGGPQGEPWLSALEQHAARGGVIAEGASTCLETEVDCGGTIVVVRTCCLAAETPEECVARHEEAVKHACD